ncbi:FAD:protein FMN transferase [Tropicimonas isoalkanivorans]|uniref:FAD:protein FMN transferase n=1 Tax=Tropicimonas isoalkanivorans TaxID=441112 RepID=A0A1I1H7E4_9RHOB|nr:FAD:protein FMN transferase [Tropicimonas isoalkanivorans]SFC19884.1 thiamine biosynthesis lipoprotein [Tropicimonas isoalkanivorans]
MTRAGRGTALLAALCVALVIGVTGVGRASRPAPVHSETLYVFGTLVEVVIEGVPEAKARAATAALEKEFRRLHRDWHAWDPGELGRLNDAIALGRTMEVSDDLADVLRQGKALSEASGGLFEPAIGALIALWGFHDDLPPDGPLPDPGRIAELREARPRMADLRFDGNRVWSVNPAVRLDLGGYAKGAALDLAAARLTDEGINNAVLNAGGDINVIGTRGAREWRLAIRDPFGWGAVAALSVHPGEAVYTSGNYERFLEHDGARFSHILDPRTGWPVGDIVSATVLDTNGARADAAATALSVAGLEQWGATAVAMGIEAALLIDREGRMYATPAMAERLELPPGGSADQALRLTVLELPRPGGAL